MSVPSWWSDSSPLMLLARLSVFMVLTRAGTDLIIPVFANTVKCLLDVLRLLLEVFIHVDFEHPITVIS